MNGRDTPPSHPSPALLAELAQGFHPDDPALLEHLAGCERCLAIHAEFVRLPAGGAVPGGRSEVPPAWIEPGLAVGRRHADAAVRRRRDRDRIVPLAAAALAVMVLGGWWLNDARRTRAAHEALARPLRIDSYGGLLYADDILPSATGVRGAASDAAADAALAGLIRRAADGARSTDEAFWLVASFLGRSDVDNADAHLREAMRRFPDEDRLHRLAGILAYKRNDLAEAARQLDLALEGERSAVNLYDRARVAEALGDEAAATALRGELAATFPRWPLSAPGR